MIRINSMTGWKKALSILLVITLIVTTVSVGLIQFITVANADISPNPQQDSDLYFNVPEAIYLKPGTTSFQYYLDQTLDINTGIISPNSESNLFDFSRGITGVSYGFSVVNNGYSISANAIDTTDFYTLPNVTTKDYLIPVTGGETYIFSYDYTVNQNVTLQPLAQYYNSGRAQIGGEYYRKEVSKGSGTHTVVVTLPEDCAYFEVRLGMDTKLLVTNATFGNITFVKAGNVNFYCSEATSVKITTTGATVNLEKDSQTGKSLNTHITGGSVSEDKDGMITWSAEYKDANGTAHTVKAYTYVYSPYTAPAFAATRNKGNRGQNSDIQSMAWISGIHGSSEKMVGDEGELRGINTANFDPIKGVLTLTDVKKSDGGGGYTQDGTTYHSTGVSPKTGVMKSFDQDSNETNTSAQAVSPRGLLYADTSRYSNFKDIPNLSIGFAVTYVKEGEKALSRRNFAYYLSDYSAEVDNRYTVTGRESNGSIYYSAVRGEYILSDLTHEELDDKMNSSLCGPRLIYNGDWDKDMITESEPIAIKAAARFGTRQNSNSASNIANNSNIVIIDVNAINKSSLRDALKTALSYGFSNSDTYKQAATVLGNPTATSGQVKDAYDSVRLRIATAIHKTENGTVKDVEQAYYIKNQDITVSKKSYPGYNLISSTPEYVDSTGENLFKLDEFVAHTPTIGGKNCASVKSQNGALIFASGTSGTDNYTKQVNQPGLYKIKVEPGQTYIFSYYACTTEGSAKGSNPKVTYAFFSYEDSTDYKYNTDFYVESGYINHEVTVPAGMYYIAFRFGNTVKQESTVFKYISFRVKTNSSSGTAPETPTEGTYLYKNCTFESITNTFIYRPINYTIEYLPNGATGVTTNATSEHVYDVAAELRPKSYIKQFTVRFEFRNGQNDKLYYPQAIFKNWLVLDGLKAGTTYKDMAQVVNLSDTDGATVQLEAQWEGMSKIDVPDDPEAEGKIFKGWYTIDESSGEEVLAFVPGSNAKIDATGDKVYYAKWEVSRPTMELTLNGNSIEGVSDVSFNPNDVVYKSSGTTVEKTIGEDGDEVKYIYRQEFNTSIEIPIPVRNGYTFVGWNRTNTNGTLVNNRNSYTYTFGSDEKIVDGLRAMWIINEYYINYMVSWGKGPNSVLQTKSYEYNSPVNAPADPIMTSYVFDGWDKEIPKNMPAENVTITAKFIDEPNAEYNKSTKAISDGNAIYLEGNSYSTLVKTDYSKPSDIASSDDEIVLKPFNASKAQAVAFNVNMTSESNAYVFLRSFNGATYVVVTGSKLDEEGKPVSKVIKVNSGAGQYYDVTDVLEPGETGTVTIRQSGIDNEFISYGYAIIGDIKLTTDKENSEKASLAAVNVENIEPIQNLIFNIPENFNPIEIPEVIFEKLITKISIRKTNAASTHELDYKTTLTLYNEVENYAGKKITWYVDDGSGKFVRKASNKDGSLTLKNLVKGFKVKCVTKDADGEEVSSSVETFTVKTGLWQRIVALFRTWFRKLPNIKY